MSLPPRALTAGPGGSMRIFLDTNILFSAAKAAGAVRELLARTVAAGHVRRCLRGGRGTPQHRGQGGLRAERRSTRCSGA